MRDFVKIHENDNVAVALREIQKGEKLLDIQALDTIPAGHKMALYDIPAGSGVIKYGAQIGTASVDIKAGQWVHTHNVKTGLGDLLTYTYQPVKSEAEDAATGQSGTLATSGENGAKVPEGKKMPGSRVFQGYRRTDGKVGIRNDVWIIPTVGCVSKIGEVMAKAANARNHFQGKVIAFQHPYGCSQMGEDQEHTRTILSDLVNHPNAGGVLVLGLGCENSGVEVLKKYIGDYDEKRVRFLVCQEVEDELEEGAGILDELIAYASGFEREPIDASELVVGLKCGGSDGFSGITANPLVGRFSDLLVASGGTTILTEVPEMFGAETFLMNRCANRELFEETVSLINDFKKYYQDNHQTIYENPSPGNKAGGITTLEDKSLGCIQKSGSAAVKGVLAYGETVTNHGLNLLSAPGNDLVAATALAASGAHLVLFTTGRGTPFAAPVPTVKIASNCSLAEHKQNWIDFDAGVLAEDAGMEEAAARLFAYVIAVASGREVLSEKAGLQDMAIFKQGVTL